MPFPAVEPTTSTPELFDPPTGEPSADGDAGLDGLVIPVARGRVQLLRMNWYGIRGVREEDEERFLRHGAWTGQDLLPALQIPFRLRISVGTAHAAHHMIAQLTHVFRPRREPVALLYRMGGVTYLRWGKPRRFDPDTSRLGTGASEIDCGFVSTDPYYYSAEVQRAGPTYLPAPGGGITPPLTPPLTLADQPRGGRLTVTNTGTQDAHPTLTITGPIGAPTVTGPGWRVQFGDLTTGETLTVDTAAGLAHVGGSQRPPAAGSSLISACQIPPGASEVRLRGTVIDPDRLPSLVAEWRHTYL